MSTTTFATHPPESLRTEPRPGASRQPAPWFRWYRWWCTAAGLYGVLLIGGALEATQGPVLALLDLLNGAPGVTLDAPARFAVGLLGCVTLGWSVTLWAAIRAAYQLPASARRPVWHLIAVALVVWFVTDGIVSVVTGYALNVLPNTVFAAAFLGPLLRGGVQHA